VKDVRILEKIRRELKLPKNFILYLGNFKPHKNVESLVKAFGRINQKCPNYRLVLSGPLDKHGKKLVQFVRNENLEDKICFTGTIRENDRPEALMSLADIFVFPSLYEGFGLPPLEAMACGTAVVASKLTSIPEVVADAGVLVNPNNIETLGNAVIDLIEQTDKRAALVDKGLKRAAKFREEHTTHMLYTHIISLMEKKS
jgi:glycosyltransferase involved in cell wall biosynthesis